MFHGSMVALVTPMTQEGQLDLNAMHDLIEWHIAAGTNAIVVAGTTGESGTLTDQEKQTLIRFAVDTAKERIPIIAGTHAESTQKTAELTFKAMALGADACLIMTPAYIKPTQEGLYQHYAYIAEQVAIPQILYNVPGRTACDLLPETVARLASIANIIGIKEATGDMSRVTDILKACQDRLHVYSGDDFTLTELIARGGRGVISVTANIAPKAMRALCDAALQGDTATIDRLDAVLQPVHKALFLESNPIPVKWALHEMGRVGDHIRLPLTVLHESYQPEVRQAIQTVLTLDNSEE